MAPSSKQPKPLPELVRDSQLETRFASKGQTIHIFHDTPTTTREEVWKREKRPIGRGAFGEVWLEKCIKGQEAGGPETRAAKVMRLIPQGEVHSELLDYARELEALAKFSQRKYSRCFVKSYGWFLGRDVLCVALEYLPMGDLGGYLSTHTGQIPEAEVQQIVSQVLDGLRLMHQEGFTHRDLKPANILVKNRPPSGNWWVVLSDFGLSKRVEHLQTGTSGLVGTPGFMAPELYGFFREEHRTIDYTAADIWCVGEITFRIITGQATFAFQATLFSYVRGECEFPALKLADCSFEVHSRAISFIQALMAAHPSGRPDVAAALCHPWIVGTAGLSGNTVVPSTTPGKGIDRSPSESPSQSSSAESDTEYGVWSLSFSHGKGCVKQNEARTGIEDLQTVRQAGPVTVADEISSTGKRYIDADSASVDSATPQTRGTTTTNPEVLKEPGTSSESSRMIAKQLKDIITRVIRSPGSTGFAESAGDRWPACSAQAITECSVLSSSDIAELVNSHTDGEKLLPCKTFLESELNTGYLGSGAHLLICEGRLGIAVGQGTDCIEIWDLNEGFSRKINREDTRQQGISQKYNNSQETAEQASLQLGYPGCVVVSPEYSNIAFTFWPDPVIYICRLPTKNMSDVGLQRLEGHQGPITSLAFAPDNFKLASASLDRTVRIWDPPKTLNGGVPGISFHVLQHAASVQGVAFVPRVLLEHEELESYQVLSWTVDQGITLWEFSGEQATLSGPDPSWKVIGTVMYSPHGPKPDEDLTRLSGLLPVVAVSNRRGFPETGLLPCSQRSFMRLQDREQGVPSREQNFVFRRLGRRGADQHIETPQKSVCALPCPWHRNGEFAIISVDTAISVWDAGTGLPILRIKKSKALQRRNYPISVLPESLLFAAASTPQSVGIWNTERMRNLHQLQHHFDNALFCAISANGRWAVSVVRYRGTNLHTRDERRPGTSPSIVIWDVLNVRPQMLIHIGNNPLEIIAVGFSADSERIGCVTDGLDLRTWLVETGEFLGATQFNHGRTCEHEGRCKPPGDWKPCVVLDPNLAGFASSHRSSPVSPDPSTSDPIYGICLTYRIGQLDTGSPISESDLALWVERRKPDEKVRSLAFSPDGQLIAEFSELGDVTVWEIHRRQVKAVLQDKERIPRMISGKTQFVRWFDVDYRDPGVAISPDNRKVLRYFSRSETRVQVWSLDGPTPKLVFNLRGCAFGHLRRLSDRIAHFEHCPADFMSPDWTYCVTEIDCGESTQIRLHDLSGQRANKTLDDIPGTWFQLNKRLVGGVSFSPDSRLVVVALFDKGQLKMWDARTGELRSTCQIGPNIESVFLWPDSTMVALTSSKTRQVRILDVQSGEYIRTYDGHTGNYVVEDAGSGVELPAET